METDNITASLKQSLLKPVRLPEKNFSRISNLTGMIRHAVFAMSNQKEGYCDNARALLLTILACNKKGANKRSLS